MRYTNTKGFTIIELVTIFVLIGILSLTAFHSFSSRSSELVTEAESLRSHIRYAQARALTYGNTYILQCTGGSYALYRGSISDSNKLALPNGKSSVTLSDKVRITSPNSTFALSFDNWGVPGIMNEGNNAPLSEKYTITLRQGDHAKTVTVTPTTGFVE
jgi:MSHA pilin protein MshC